MNCDQGGIKKEAGIAISDSLKHLFGQTAESHENLEFKTHINPKYKS
jgi:hypothetical protein